MRVEIDTSATPIIIPFKHESKRCPMKNYALFDATVRWLKDEGVDGGVYVVSKSWSALNFARMRGKALGFDVRLIEECDRSESNISACYFAARALGASQYFELPLASPFRERGLLVRMLDKLESDPGLDFVTTCQHMADRGIFALKDCDGSREMFEVESRERKGVLCKDKRHVDGSAYLIRPAFMHQIDGPDRPGDNELFWSGRFATVENCVPFFVDVDTDIDYERATLIGKAIGRPL